MPTTEYTVIGNPTQANEVTSDEIFTTEQSEAIGIVAGNIEDVVLVAENGESWATRAEQGAADAEAAAANVVATIIIVSLAGGSTDTGLTGIAAAWAATGRPTPTGSELVFANYASLCCILVDRANAGVNDSAWSTIADNTIVEAPKTGNYYGRRDGVWAVIPSTSLTLDDLVNVTVPTPVDGYVLRYEAATQTWKATVDRGASGPLGGMSNVADAVDTAAEGQVLVKRGAEWVAETPAPAGSIMRISQRLTGPATYTVDGNDIDALIIADATGGKVTIQYAPDLTTGDDHIVSGLVRVVGATASNPVEFVGIAAGAGGAGPVPERDYNSPPGAYNRNSSSSTVAASDRCAITATLPLAVDAALVVFSSFHTPTTIAMSAARPSLKIGGVIEAWDRIQNFDDVTTGPPPMLCVAVVPLGTVSAGTVKNLIHAVAGGLYNGVCGNAFLVSGVHQTNPIDVSGGSSDNTGALLSISNTLVPTGANRLCLWHAAKRNYGTVSPPTGANTPAAPTATGSGVSLVTEMVPNFVGAEGIADPNSIIHNTNSHGAIAQATASASVTATIGFPTAQDIAIQGVALRPADILLPSMAVYTPNNVPAKIEAPKLVAGWLYEGAPHNIVQMVF